MWSDEHTVWHTGSQIVCFLKIWETPPSRSYQHTHSSLPLLATISVHFIMRYSLDFLLAFTYLFIHPLSHLPIHPSSIHPPIYPLSICPPILQPLHLFIHISVHPSPSIIRLSIPTSIHPSSIHLFTHPFMIYSPTHPSSIYPPTRQPCPPIHSPICPSIPFFIHLIMIYWTFPLFICQVVRSKADSLPSPSL